MPLKTADLKKILRKTFASEMKDLGFSKISDLSWTKRGNEPYIFSIQIFPSNSGGYCWIEAGVHLSFIPLNSDGKDPKDKTVETINSMFRKRLTNTLNDRSDFIYGDEIEGLKILSDYLFWAVKDEAEKYFLEFDSFPGSFESISISEIKNKTDVVRILEFGNEMIQALELARINLFLGNKMKSIEFANYGLSLIEGKRGSGLIPQFEKIKEGKLYLN